MSSSCSENVRCSNPTSALHLDTHVWKTKRFCTAAINSLMSLAFVAADASREQNTALDHVYSKFLYTEDPQTSKSPNASRSWILPFYESSQVLELHRLIKFYSQHEARPNGVLPRGRSFHTETKIHATFLDTIWWYDIWRQDTAGVNHNGDFGDLLEISLNQMPWHREINCDHLRRICHGHWQNGWPKVAEKVHKHLTRIAGRFFSPKSWSTSKSSKIGSPKSRGNQWSGLSHLGNTFNWYLFSWFSMFDPKSQICHTMSNLLLSELHAVGMRA